MTTMTIRNLDTEVQRRLRVRAAERGVSMEQEVRDTLRVAVMHEEAPAVSWIDALRAVARDFGGVELELPVREPMREPPDFRA